VHVPELVEHLALVFRRARQRERLLERLGGFVVALERGERLAAVEGRQPR
jgi:hypothetical protein